MARRILIVDDEEVIRALLREMLRDAGYETIETGQGKEALALVSSELPDLVVLDLMLPDIGGWDVLERLRAEERREGRPELPVVVLSKRDEPEVLARVTALGADMYLEKSLGEEQQLVSVVRRLLAQDA
jgi:two-component system OmpR family response regulator